MAKKLSFYSLLILLGVLFFFNPNLKTISAGVAILLFGMILLEEGFAVFTRGPLQHILRKATDKLYKSISTGALVTAFLQSSSLVTIITISFISAGLINLSGGIGLIFGANLGTTATAWLVATLGLKVKISALALPMLVFGVIFSFQQKKTLKGIGNILAGLGFFFLGIHYMKEGFDVYRDYIDLTQYAIPGFWGIVVYTIIGIVITTILQSSSATLALIITALSAGQIEYENALALTIGANIGTTITAFLGSISSNVAGKRLAGAHFIFNVVTGIVAIAIIYPLSDLVNYLTDLIGFTPDNYTLKLALFHTFFNLLGVLIMIPFIGKLEKFLVRTITEKADKDIEEPKYLTESVLTVPSSAVRALLNETKYLFKNAIFEIVAHALNIHRDDIKSDKKIKTIVKRSTEDFGVDPKKLYYQKVKRIYGLIIQYATQTQNTSGLSPEHSELISKIKVAARKMVEIVRDVNELHKNLNKYLYSDNEYIRKEYDKFRKKIVKVMRIIYRIRAGEAKEKHYETLMKLKKEARLSIHNTNKSMDKLIRNNLITPEMTSSLVNDNDNVNDIIKKLISITELLYIEKDSLLENNMEYNTSDDQMH